MIDVIDLVPYKDSDYEFVYELKKLVYKKYVEECFGIWNEKVQREYYDNFINKVYKRAYIIMKDNTRIGFYNGEIKENGNYEIGNVCILSEYQRKGIGSTLLRKKLKENKNRDIEIRFFKQNPVVKLYQRLGFKIYSETEYHYLMKKLKEK